MGYFKPLTGTWLASVLTALIFGATVFGSGAVVLLSTTTECGAGEGGLWGGGGGSTWHAGNIEAISEEEGHEYDEEEEGQKEEGNQQAEGQDNQKEAD